MPSLAGDLKNIRRDHKLSIQDMYELTRIPLDIIKAIEDGTLFEDESRNSTYIRSFVRTYSRALKISEEDIVAGLDDQIIGVYNGFLSDKYGSGSSKTEKGKEDDTGSTQKSKYGSRFKLDLPEDEAEKPEPESPEEKPEEEESEELPEEEEEDLFPEESESVPEEPEQGTNNQSTIEREEYSLPDPGKPYNRKVPEPPSVKSVDWASVGKRTYSLSRRPGILLLILLVIVVFAGVTFIVVRKMSNTSGQKSNAGIAQVDSLKTPPLMNRDDSVKAGLLPPTVSTLPDTLKLTVYAAFGPLGPVRVQTDLARKMNPYWIDEGEGMRFNFKDSIEVRGVYKNMILLYKGHPLSDFRQHIQKSTGVLQLARSYFKEHPEWQTVTHDSLPGGVPQPSVVRNQPLY
ncbi:MAG TPA: helix-turn-helix domain-containing protein [Balneolales bacterium]|nr:helix-turn-helix domain-containing protein [Balneolales bacterium]